MASNVSVPAASRLVAVDRLLRQIVSQIEPTKAQKEGAQRSHYNLRNQLSTGKMAMRILDSYLSGSYARDTAIRPLDDVDIVFCIDPEAWEKGLLDSHPAPARVLDTFAAAIRYRYPDSSVHRQRRSVGLKLNHIAIDAVPAICDARDEKSILVPDRNASAWIKSAPRRHSDLATSVNAKRGAKFKPLVKLLKSWNSRLPETARCKSFMVETMACRIFAETHFDTLAEGLILFWDFAASRYHEPLHHWRSGFGMSFNWFDICVPDLAGTGSNTAARVDGTRAKAFAEKARISREKLLEAQAARFEDTLATHVREALRI